MALKHTIIKNFTTGNSADYQSIDISFEVFGKELHSAPIIVVVHALTGNSDVLSKEKGWWKELIGDHKLMNTKRYTVIAFNIPGNGYAGELIENYRDFVAKDIAQLFLLSLEKQAITNIFAAIGGSLGGGIVWEMAALQPKFIEYIIPIAADWKATDWLMGQCFVQEQIVINTNYSLEDVRKMAMLFYRTPKSFTRKFMRTKTSDNKMYNVNSWLNHHGRKLEKRFYAKAYLMMNQLLSSIDITTKSQSFDNLVSKITGTIVQIAINSDLIFVPDEIMATKEQLNRLNVKNEYHEILSDDGHDAFLIEHQQITNFLQPIFPICTQVF